jgi:hypothetical protein
MTELEHTNFSEVLEVLEVLNTMSPRKKAVFVAAVQLFLECCQDGTDLSAVLIVRHPPEDSDPSNCVLRVSALNADKDDAYEILDLACSKLASDIAKEAPDRDRYN